VTLVLLFLLIPIVPLHAYIDPGTGSMLFSLITCLTVTVFFFTKNLLLRIKSGNLFNTKRKIVVQNANRSGLVIYSEGKQYWNVFKPILEELWRRQIPWTYYSSGPDDPGLSFQGLSPRGLDAADRDIPGLPGGTTARYIGQGNEAYRFLNFLEADLCLMTTPGLDVFQLKRSPGVRHYSHIVHMVTDTTTYRLFSLDFFDSVLLAADYQQRDIRTLEELRGTRRKDLYVVGCTYLDALREKLGALPPRPPSPGKTVLAAPSWGKNGLLSRYGLRLLTPLAESSWHLIIRPHPQSVISERGMLERLQAALAAHKNVEWNFDAENLEALSRSDLLISDFSGVIFDFAFLFNRPVVYPRFEFDKRPYDASDIEEEAWVFRALRELGDCLEEEHFAGIEGFLDGVITGKRAGGILEQVQAEGYPYPGEAGRRTVDALERILAPCPG